MRPTDRVVIGIDFGGTGVRFVAIPGIPGEPGSAAATVVAESSHLTAELGAGAPAARIGRVLAEVRRLVPDGSELQAVGIGATGPVDPVTGEIHNQATLPSFSDIGLARALEVQSGRPVGIDNDAVAAAYGEYSAGAGRGSPRLLMITLGTGVGGALLIGGQPYRTNSGGHPEIGHIPVGDGGPPCYCGLAGCWEPQASRAALQRSLGQHLGRAVAEGEILTTAGERGSGDPGIGAILHRYGERVGRGLACLQAVHGPADIVVGGGAARLFPQFESGIRSAMTQNPEYSVPARVVAAALGERAGAIGAAAMARDRLGDG